MSAPFFTFCKVRVFNAETLTEYTTSTGVSGDLQYVNPSQTSLPEQFQASGPPGITDYIPELKLYISQLIGSTTGGQPFVIQPSISDVVRVISCPNNSNLLGDYIICEDPRSYIYFKRFRLSLARIDVQTNLGNNLFTNLNWLITNNSSNPIPLRVA